MLLFLLIFVNETYTSYCKSLLLLLFVGCVVVVVVVFDFVMEPVARAHQ